MAAAVVRSVVVFVDLTDEHFEHCLAIWTRWMERGRSTAQGFPGRAWIAGRARNLYGSDEDNDIAYEAADDALAMAVDACMVSLMPSHKHAIYIDRGIARAWLFKDLSYELELVNAVACLRRLIARRC